MKPFYQVVGLSVTNGSNIIVASISSTSMVCALSACDTARLEFSLGVGSVGCRV